MTAFAVIGILGAALLVLSLLVGDPLDDLLEAIDVTGGYPSTAMSL